MNTAVSCQCGWVGIAPTYSQAVTDHLYHQMYGGMGHSALNMTVVPEHMGHCELSIFRQEAHQDGLDYRAQQQVKGREQYRCRRAEDSPLYVADDGLDAARGVWSALKVMGVLVFLAVCCILAVRMK